MTNEALLKRGLHASGESDLCEGSREDVSHVIRDCAVAREVWKNVVPPLAQGTFFQIDIQVWLTINLYDKRDEGHSRWCDFFWSDVPAILEKEE